jgi:hypothetical protein
VYVQEETKEGDAPGSRPGTVPSRPATSASRPDSAVPEEEA